MEKVDVPLEVARAVLFHFGDDKLGVEPGSFVTRLLSTLSAADETNRAKLHQVFPEYVYAFHCVQREYWGLEWLRSKVKAAEVPDRSRPVDLFESAAQS
ncbi:MAG: hypothetical protein WED09_07425 [Homoserinimonas sp.]